MSNLPPPTMEDDAVETTQSFSANSDLCKQLLNRYAQSSAAQHRHLCATAAATRSIIESSSLSLIPISYFAATITSISNSKTLDSTALAALSSFLSIVLPLVSKGEIKPEKAREAVSVLVGVVEKCESKLGTSSVRAVVKCVGVLVTEFCNSKEWDSVAVGFEWLVKFSLDKRPKVRKCAQDCLVAVFKSFESSSIIKKASKLIYSLLKDRMPLAMEMTASEIVQGSKTEALSRPQHQEVLHLLNVMKHVVPYLSIKVCTSILSQLLKILSSLFSALTRHIFEVISVIFETSGFDIIISNAEEIIKPLVSYTLLVEKNPVDTVLSAATLASSALGKLSDGDITKLTNYLPILTESLAGLLSSEAHVALQASKIFRELIEHYIDINNQLIIEGPGMEDKKTPSAEAKAMAMICTVLYNVLSKSNQIPNEHILSIVDFMFLKLGQMSHILMKDIILKLAELMNVTTASTSEIEHLQDCIGSAVSAMGPEKLLELLPISFSTVDFSCYNIWLIQILKKNVVGSSLRFFKDHIAPLAESFEHMSKQVKNSVIAQDLHAYAHGCWGLFPAFCRQPSDTYESFPALVKLLLPFIKKDSFMLENISIGLWELVNQNKRALELEPGNVYSRKVAKKNVKALALCSNELLPALSHVFFESPPEMRKHLKDAIGCLVSICDSSITKQIFVASLKKFQLLDQDDIDEHGNVNPETNTSAGEEVGTRVLVGANVKRSLVMDLASCYVDGSDKDLVNLLFCLVKRTLQATEDTCHTEALQALSRILEKQSWFCSSQFYVVMDLLTGLKSSANIQLQKGRFSCLQALLIHEIMTNMDEENTNSFTILNEIILALKDSNEEGRKAAYDALNAISSKLQNSSDATSDKSYHKLLTMLTGYLSGSSPQIKSGVVSALSVLVYSNPQICIMMPDIVPSVMELLHTKMIEVIKAVLGFVKVLVSSLEQNDLRHFLTGIMDGILRWSSVVSRHHFKTKITVILEIMIRKCGTAAVKVLAPEKYKDFVNDVVANRHGKKTSTKEDGTGDTRIELSDSSAKRQQKRKRDESADLPKEEGSVRPWKKRGDTKQNKTFKSSERVEHSDHNNKPNKHKGGNRIDFKRDFSGGKKHEEMTVMKKNDADGNRYRRAVASKLPKNKKNGNKGRKIS